ncbi:cytochrome C biogenesis protein [Bacillus sp. OxB-1]|uniref:hypothetical protein n=1 Tax=Bacillus sp. (strain OxB-1) TaxID=98228 RepID=UPI0005821556|nr:hypothetical protein [Bacillus sp. OxB-1]BAQ10933.1 cytochrome C biogenesis protein [Bacillus sp. OxB-1]
MRLIPAFILSLAVLAGCGAQDVNEAAVVEEPVDKVEVLAEDEIGKSSESKEEPEENEQTKQLYQFETMTFELMNGETARGQFQVNLLDPAETYEIAERVKAELLEYFPDYDHDGEKPISRSPSHWNPAFIFKLTDGNQQELLFSTIDRTIKAEESHTLNVAVVDVTTTTFEGTVPDGGSTFDEVFDRLRKAIGK